MDIKVNNIAQVTQVPDTVTTETGDGTFKFTLASAITDADLQAKVDLLMNDICLLYTSPSPRDGLLSRMPSSA